nr:hypothetical protein [Candidatus Brachybacter algidus]
MDSKDFISDEILKQFKTGDELMSFLTSIQNEIEKILEDEMDSHNFDMKRSIKPCTKTQEMGLVIRRLNQFWRG